MVEFVGVFMVGQLSKLGDDRASDKRKFDRGDRAVLVRLPSIRVQEKEPNDSRRGGGEVSMMRMIAIYRVAVFSGVAPENSVGLCVLLKWILSKSTPATQTHTSKFGSTAHRTTTKQSNSVSFSLPDVLIFV